MKIAVTGSTGFIGRNLARVLAQAGHEVTAISRDPSNAATILNGIVHDVKLQKSDAAVMAVELKGIDAIVNLAGENIGSSLWTKRKRSRILESRVKTGQFITEIVRHFTTPPGTLIQASAVGYYGSRGEELLTEASDRGDGFLPRVAVDWENSIAETEAMGVRTIVIRSGVVLASHGGAFKRLALPYRLHVGTTLGTGMQWVSWIHLEDELNAIMFLLTTSKCIGTYNLVAPSPARLSEIGNCLGRTLLKVPTPIVRLALGKMGEETVLTSQRVVPDRIVREGFKFKFPTISDAIRDIRK